MTDDAALAAELGGALASDQALGALTVDLPVDGWLAGLARAREAGYRFFDWLTGVDLGPDGFAVVVHLYAVQSRAHVLLRTTVARDEPVVPSATTVYPGADWHERETAEMFGITFEGHPDPRPLLLADDLGAHPLRKDFVLAARASTEWPGAVDPETAGGRRRRPQPPGVPGPGAWPDGLQP
jgi:NADH-quinone oxidoreductase subunit C